MLLRQSFVRTDAHPAPYLAVSAPCQPAFRLCRASRPGWHDFHTRSAFTSDDRITSCRAADVAEAPTNSSVGWQQLLLEAQPATTAIHVAQPHAVGEWSIPPHLWAQHPTLLNGCERESAPLRVAMLLSGGVDSSVAMNLVKAAGHHVTAFYLQIWFQEDFRNSWDACPWEEDLSYCQQVCEQAGVPLEVVPLTQQYWDRVVSHSIAEIKAGRTPNPDILCNSRVKFGAFLEHLEIAHAGQFDRLASGHYASVRRDTASGVARLEATADAVKDQTYFLAHLSQAQLARTMFPLAALTKGGTRQLAAAADLPNQARRDSQGICFLGKVQHGEFVKEHLGEWPGPLIEEDTGKVLGYHQGFWFHTIGQRKGVPLSGGPWYVVRKDTTKNAVYISRNYHAPDRLRNGFRCGPFHWLDGVQPAAERLRQCKVRHGPAIYNCQVAFEEDGTRADVALDGQDQGLAPGQYAVFYDGATCLGSAVICEALDMPDVPLADSGFVASSPEPS